MNVITIIGRMTRDPEIRTYGSENKKLASFSVAVNRVGEHGENVQTVDFFNCTAFGNSANFIEKYFKKGKRIGISGEARNNQYTDKDGNSKIAFEILVKSVDFADSSDGEKKNAQSKPNNDGFVDVNAEDLPFN